MIWSGVLHGNVDHSGVSSGEGLAASAGGSSKFPDALLISADKKVHIEELKERLYETLGFIRIFMKPQGKPADMNEPLIVRQGSSVADICDKLHRDFKKRFRYAQIWGSSAKHEGQRAGLDHMMYDNDVLTLVLRK